MRNGGRGFFGRDEGRGGLESNLISREREIGEKRKGLKMKSEQKRK